MKRTTSSRSTAARPSADRAAGRQGEGAGIIVHPSGLLVTSAHVVRRDPVRMPCLEREETATVLERDAGLAGHDHHLVAGDRRRERLDEPPVGHEDQDRGELRFRVDHVAVDEIAAEHVAREQELLVALERAHRLLERGGEGPDLGPLLRGPREDVLVQRAEPERGRVELVPDAVEAGEELPTHKDTPGHGGPKRRFQMTSGHNRWSIHSMNMTNRHLLNTHRGVPFVFMNDKDAASLGIANGDQVKLVSDIGECIIQAKITPACRPSVTLRRPSSICARS